MSQIASKQIVFLIIILRIVHAYIVYQLLLIFVKLPPPTFSANVLQKMNNEFQFHGDYFKIFLRVWQQLERK